MKNRQFTLWCLGGILLGISEAAAVSSTFAYDAAGRLVSMEVQEETYRIDYSYDGRGNLAGVTLQQGRRMVDPFAEASYLGDDLFDTGWMGLAYVPEDKPKEVYLREQGWISIGLALSGGLWYWDYAMLDWVYTHPALYPALYTTGLDWLLYWDPFSNVNTRWFYRYADDDYHSFPRYPGPIPYE
jgi:YD repeat-containing protein